MLLSKEVTQSDSLTAEGAVAPVSAILRHHPQMPCVHFLLCTARRQ